MRINLIGVLVLALLSTIIATVSATAIQEAKEDSKAAQCKDNLKKIAVATHSYHEAHNRMPVLTVHNEDFHGSWSLLLLPYLEDGNTFTQFALTGRGDSETNLPLVNDYRNKVWQCPTRRSGETYDFSKDWATNWTGVTFEDCLPTDYAAVHTADSNMWSYQANGIIVNPRTSVSQTTPFPTGVTTMASCTDGTSNTGMFGEKHMHKNWLGKPVSGEDSNDGIDLPVLIAANGPMTIRVASDQTAFGAVTLAPKADYDTKSDPLSVNMFGSWHDGVTHFVNVDGAVREIGNFADTEQLRLYTQRNDRQAIEFPLKQTQDQ